MAFPLSSVFQGIKSLINITVTADANGAPELIHLADEAGTACAHFAVHEWDTLGEHLADLIHTELEAATAPAAPLGGTLTDPAPAPVTPTQPFLPPADTADGTAADAGGDGPEETAPAGEDQQA